MVISDERMGGDLSAQVRSGPDNGQSLLTPG